MYRAGERLIQAVNAVNAQELAADAAALDEIEDAAEEMRSSVQRLEMALFAAGIEDINYLDDLPADLYERMTAIGESDSEEAADAEVDGGDEDGECGQRLCEPPAAHTPSHQTGEHHRRRPGQDGRHANGQQRRAEEPANQG